MLLGVSQIASIYNEFRVPAVSQSEKTTAKNVIHRQNPGPSNSPSTFSSHVLQYIPMRGI